MGVFYYAGVRYAYLDGQPLARIDDIDDDTHTKNAIRYYHNNHLGAPLQVTDQQGQVVWDADYDPFGKATFTHATISQNLRLPGQYYDAESGWHYTMQRYYDPGLGRYLQSDLIGLRGGINTYTYVLNNPLRYIDPLGLESTVYVWQPVGWGGSSFGHVSADINGTTYSYGPSGMTILPTSDYLSKNSFRDGTGVTLNINSQQEKSLQACLSKPQDDYSALTNNCGTLVQSCLKDQGIDTGNQTLPVSLGNKLLDMGIVNGVRNSPATTPANGSSAPWAR